MPIAGEQCSQAQGVLYDESDMEFKSKPFVHMAS